MDTFWTPTFLPASAGGRGQLSGNRNSNWPRFPGARHEGLKSLDGRTNFERAQY